MALESLQVWKDTLEDLPEIDSSLWATNFANWYADRVLPIEPDSNALVPSGFSFAFATAVFITALQSLTPTTSLETGITGFATAWETALMATVVSVASGTYVPPPSSATTFSAVASTIIDPASIAAGKLKIMELTSAPLVDDTQLSQFPEKFREATQLLTITVSGSDSDEGSPLVAPMVPLV